MIATNILVRQMIDAGKKRHCFTPRTPTRFFATDPFATIAYDKYGFYGDRSPTTTARHHAAALETSDTEGLRQQTVDGFTDKFQAAIDELPKLTTFISRPMPRTHKIITSGYPVSAEFLQASPRPLARLQPETGLIEANDGLFLFLLPGMNRPTSTVTRLKWVDELPGWSYMRPMPLSFALRRLRSLDLSPTPALSRAWANRQQ